MGALADLIDSLPKTHGGTRCVTGDLIGRLKAADRSDLEAAFADSRITVPMIAKALIQAGYTPSRSSLARHRRGDCGCTR